MMNDGKTKHAFPTALRMKRLQAGIALVAVVVTSAIAYWYLTRARRPLVRELQIQATDVTLYVRVAGNPESGNVLIAIHVGPGMSSGYIV
jgi:anti-sigma-K factor RskA